MAPPAGGQALWRAARGMDAGIRVGASRRAGATRVPGRLRGCRAREQRTGRGGCADALGRSRRRQRSPGRPAVRAGALGAQVSPSRAQLQSTASQNASSPTVNPHECCAEALGSDHRCTQVLGSSQLLQVRISFPDTLCRFLWHARVIRNVCGVNRHGCCAGALSRGCCCRAAPAAQ